MHDLRPVSSNAIHPISNNFPHSNILLYTSSVIITSLLFYASSFPSPPGFVPIFEFYPMENKSRQVLSCLMPKRSSDYLALLKGVAT